VPDLEHSARRLLRATYTPFVNDPKRRLKGQAWPKFSLLAALQPTHDEVIRLRRVAGVDPSALAAAEGALEADGNVVLDRVAPFADVDWSSLSSVAEHLAELRRQDLDEAREAHAAIADAHARQRRSETARPVGLTELLEWALANDVRVVEARKLLDALPQRLAVPHAATMGDFESSATLDLWRTHNLAAAIKRQATVEPVGLLHLERLNFVPAGIERGELVHSVPLSPGEEVNISHKEWSHTSEEFSRIVTDFMEAYSEEGVTEKSELTESASSQEQHSSGFNTGVTASGGYGSVTITASLASTAAESASMSEQSARNHSLTTTQKASSRSKKEHKVSFKVASAAGTEDQQVRKLKNPFEDRASRVDYYQLLRKWRVDLHRYGLRLTYDLMIPEPGSGIVSKIVEIQEVTAALELGFGDPTAPEDSPAYFALTPNELDAGSWEQEAARYGADVDGPPPPEIPDEKALIPPSNTADQARNEAYATLAFEAPKGYVIDDAVVVQFNVDDHQDVELPAWAGIVSPPSQGEFPILASATPSPQDPVALPIQQGMSDLTVVVRWAGALVFLLVVRVAYRRTSDAFNEWQMKTWAAIRDAARARFEEYRQFLKDRLSRLQEEVGAQDPLSLRKIEREEVMKGVLRWLFGPGFDFAPSAAKELPSDVGSFKKGGLAQGYWTYVMSAIRAQGEVIRFLHHAIEWENMLYFLYPYFWSHPDRWEFKKYLDHPDLMHRAFLKAGSARVVLTIRPDFEKSFLSFFETGTDSGDHPYLEIAEEMRVYAQTNYPGVTSANPIDDARPLLSPRQRKAWDEMQAIIGLLEEYREANDAYPTTEQGLAALAPFGDVPGADPWGNAYSYTSPGEAAQFDLVSFGGDGAPGGDGEDADIASSAEANLIGRWFEYTPTSALTVAFDEELPVEVPVV
jgi:hypothetical protein